MSKEGSMPVPSLRKAMATGGSKGGADVVSWYGPGEEMATQY